MVTEDLLQDLPPSSPAYHHHFVSLDYGLHLSHCASEIQSGGRIHGITTRLRVALIGRTCRFQLHLTQRPSCPVTQLFYHTKLVGHQDLSGTQPPPWLLQWLQCILGLTQWVPRRASRSGDLTPLSWETLSFPHHQCTNIRSPIPSLHHNRRKPRRPLPVLVTFLLHQIPSTVMRWARLECRPAAHTQQQWHTRTTAISTLHQHRAQRTTAIHLHIISNISTSNSKINMAKPVEVCSLNYGTIVNSNTKTHSGKG